MTRMERGKLFPLAALCLTLGGGLVPSHGQSLFPLDNTHAGLMADTRAMGIGDIVTIIVSERTTASDTSAAQTQRKTKVEPSVAAGAIKVFNDIFGKLGFESDDSQQTSGTTTHQGTLTTQLSARIVDELPNGNLLIEGRREIAINNETQFVKLTGIIRRKDISVGNTIPSTLVSDARIAYYGKGPIANKHKPGVLQKVLDILF